MKVGEQCLYLAQMKGLSKAEAKTIRILVWEIGNSRLVEQENSRTF
jgi:hypothetical protein